MQANSEQRRIVDSQDVGVLYETLIRAIAAAEERGETRYQLAKRTGVSQSTLSRIVTRQTENVSLDTLERLIDVLGIEVKLRKR